MYDRLCKKDVNSFWKTWRKRFCSRNVKPTTVLNGKQWVENVVCEFTELYRNVYQPNTVNADSTFQEVKSRLDECSVCDNDMNSYNFDMSCIASHIDFADDNNFIVSDLRRLTDTYISDDDKKMSWINHLLCTASVDNIVSHMSILEDVICSDHKPLYFSLECSVAANDCFTQHPVHGVRWVPNWQQCDDLTLFYYAQRVDELLQQV